jgi:hypothetical protein
MLKCYPRCLHRDLVAEYAAAVEAQNLKAEAWSGGHATELEEFYRMVEARLTFKAWLLGMARR